MLSIRRFIFVLFLTVLFSISSHPSESLSATVDPVQYRRFVDLLKELYDLQDPAFSKWELNRTQRMHEILVALQEMKSQGFVLSKTDSFLRTLNRLVENMHAHCLVLSCAANPGTVLLRCGKTPENLEFGGILAQKVSDFDLTVVGKKAAQARDLQMSLLRKKYGEKFVDMTMTDLTLADSTLAAWTLPDVEKAYASAVLNPELHRTYSGLQFVEDYVLKVGEISYLDEDGNFVTKKIGNFDGPGLKKQREQFIEWANIAFEKSGHKIRFGKREGDFCLGLVSDISNQMWMNLGKEAFQENPHNVVKKYLQRYVDEIQSRMGIDLTAKTAYGDVYNELKDLIHQCDDKTPGALEKLKKRMGDYEAYIRSVVAEKQAALYAEALAAGKSERAAAILLDTKGALQNLELLEQRIPTGSLGELGRVAAKELAEH
ncbi:MAG: hypothetical protein KJ645_07075, partial [Planctomycetes bacterium]|nr:hypothetical protein [Planctomycetota bacterium]